MEKHQSNAAAAVAVADGAVDVVAADAAVAIADVVLVIVVYFNGNKTASRF